MNMKMSLSTLVAAVAMAAGGVALAQSTPSSTGDVPTSTPGAGCTATGNAMRAGNLGGGPSKTACGTTSGSTAAATGSTTTSSTPMTTSPSASSDTTSSGSSAMGSSAAMADSSSAPARTSSTRVAKADRN